MADSSRRLRAAVIGVGYLGRFHAQKYKHLDTVDLVAVVDSSAERAKEIGEELGVPGYTDYRKILDQVDLVSISVPTQLHFGITQTCLKAGVHVLLEKPMTNTLEEADTLIALAEKKNLVLQVGHLKRFHPAVVALNKSKILDTPKFIEAQRLAPFKSRSLDVDVVMDLMIHDIDLILNFVQSEPVEIEAIGTPVLTKHVDIANARIKFTNGCIADVTASRIARGTIRNIRLFQNDAYIVLDFPKKEIRLMQRTEGTMIKDGAEVAAVEESSLPIEDHDTLEVEIAAFVDSVSRGVAPQVSGRDGRKALDVAIRIREAIAKQSVNGLKWDT
ncbi:MAG: Gfo/Idh/MocA family oxidoreductase [Magnetococcales bacterium]|nr:Gfo/Idh/MocA family oxidoreductase [Magnetococcales bacterium]